MLKKYLLLVLLKIPIEQQSLLNKRELIQDCENKKLPPQKQIAIQRTNAGLLTKASVDLESQKPSQRSTPLLRNLEDIKKEL
ncbi:MAG: hypothetical protein HOM88_02640 [Hellea sp.]|nr:hypothetical protein [Hellea sp.]